MPSTADRRLKTYQITVTLSILIALLGFLYNVWRLEHSEYNSNVRTACFEVLVLLSEVEQLVYAAHYDNDPHEGNPRKGWVKIGLIQDLSVLTDDAVIDKSKLLKSVWAEHWEMMPTQRASTDLIVKEIDETRQAVKALLHSLQ